MTSLVLQPADPAGRPPSANLVLRGLAYVIDIVIVSAVLFIAGLRWGTEVQPGRWQVNGLPACGIMLFVPCYWLLCETLFGATFGKFLSGLRVLSLRRDDLALGQVVKRNLVKVCDLPTCGLVSLAAALSNPLRQSLGDLWANTMIVQTKAYAKWRAGTGGVAFEDWLKSFQKVEEPER